MKVNPQLDKAISITLTAKRITLRAVRERIEQPEAFNRARRAVVAVLESDGSEVDALIAGGDAYFLFIKETCAVENQ